MPKKATKTSAPKKHQKSYVNLYELVATFTDRTRQLVHHVEEKDRVRLLNYLGDSCDKHGFYELGGHTGHEFVINTRHLAKLNVLDYLPGIQFEAEPDPDDEETRRRIEERDDDETPVILRIWIRGEPEPEIHHDVEQAAWVGIRHNLIGDAKFIEFEDEDGEEVLYGVDHLDAIEAIDPFYLKNEQVDKLLKRYDDADDTDDTADTDETTAPPSNTDN